MKEDVKHINWTGPLANERVPQSLIGGRKGVFVDCSNATAEEVLGHNATWQFDACRIMDGKRSEGRNR